MLHSQIPGVQTVINLWGAGDTIQPICYPLPSSSPSCLASSVSLHKKVIFQLGIIKCSKMIEGKIDSQVKDRECVRNPVWIIPSSWDPSVLTIFFFFQNMMSFIFQSRVYWWEVELSKTTSLLNLIFKASVLKNVHKIFIFKVMKREKSYLYSAHKTPMVLKMIKPHIQCLLWLTELLSILYIVFFFLLSEIILVKVIACKASILI